MNWIRLLAAAGVTAALFLAYQLGQKHYHDRHVVELDDQLSRIGSVQNVLLDMSMRIHHYHAHKNHANPWCPECYDLRRRQLEAEVEINDENFEELLGDDAK